MRNNLIILFGIMLLNIFGLIGQLNFQAGYDYGSITKQKNRNLHRFIFNTEYTLKNDLSFSLFIGRDIYISRNKGSSFNNCVGKSQVYNVNYFSTVTGFSFGYGFDTSDNSSLLLKVSAEGYIYDGVRIKESIRTTKEYPSNCNGSMEALKTETRFIDGSNSYINRFGAKGSRKFIFPLLTFSLEYRIKVNPLDLILHLGASPERNNLYKNDRVIRGNYIFTGLRLGYTFPQKTKTNEK